MENIRNQTQIEQRRAHTKFLVGAVVVLLLAAAMRLVALQNIPPGLAQDEILNADVATFIRQGNHALFFREGYGHEPLYHYWTVPFQVLIGDNFLSIRLPAVYLGLLLIALTMRWIRREFSLFAALATGAAMAISWWPIVFSRVGIRPIMEPVFLVLFAWFWPRRPWLAGLALGLSVYTYTGARVVFILPVMLIVYWIFAVRWNDVAQVQFLRWRLASPQRAAFIVLLAAFVVIIPLVFTLWADPSLQQRVQQLEGPLQALVQGHARPILSSTALTLGIFSFSGDPRWTYSLPGRPLFDVLTAVIFYGGLFLAIVRFKHSAYALAVFLLVVGLIPSAVTPQAPSTVRIIGALPVVYLMPAIALDWLWNALDRQKRVKRGIARLVMLGLLAVLLVLNTFLTIRDGFIEWPESLEAREKYQTVFLDIARSLGTLPATPVVIADGFYRPITADTLRRDMAEEMPVRWVQTGSDVAGAMVVPYEGYGQLYIPEYAAPDPELLITAGVSLEPLYRSTESPSYAVYSLDGDFKAQIISEQITFGDRITLVGYDTSVAQDEQSIQLFLVWRIDNSLPADLASFVHWIDDGGSLISQYDGFDAAPETLQEGDLVIQRYVLPFPEDYPIESSSFHIGFYTRDNGNRLLRQGESAESMDRLIISHAELFK